MLIDSSCSGDIVDEPVYRSMSSRLILDKARSVLHAYSEKEPLELLGQFTTTLPANGRSCQEVVSVVRGRKGCLLKYDMERRLALYQTEPFSINTASKQMASIDAPFGNYSALVAKHPKLFNDKISILLDEEGKPP